MKKIAINGFGRIGRLFFRQIFKNPKVQIVAINDLGELENLAYLLKYDSVYREFNEEIEIRGKELIVGGKKIDFFQEKELKNLPWKKLGIDVAVEATGVFAKFELAKGHLEAGAKNVVITAPAKDNEGVAGGKTILVGINDDKLKSCKIFSNGSCTTNAVAPVISVLSKNPGIKKAVLNTIHAYTATQSIVDGPVKGEDFRRGRAAAQNMGPSTTGAAIAVSRVIPEMKGKFDGIAIRVPVVCGSLADITFIAKKRTSVEEINRILKKAAGSKEWKGILKVVDEQIVSSDIIGNSHPAIVDLSFTKVIDGDLVKILSWYDNEWGYVATLVSQVLKI